MSADNFVVVRKFPDGWRWGMGFASDQYPDDRLPDEKFRSDPFATSEAAVEDAESELDVIEYGIHVDHEPTGRVPAPEYIGLTYLSWPFRWEWQFKLWRKVMCKRQIHLFDEVLSSGGNPWDHYLVCDACQLMVYIDRFEHKYELARH